MARILGVRLRKGEFPARNSFFKCHKESDRVPFQGKGAVLVDLDGRIAFASTYFCDLVGVEHDKVAGMSCFDFVFPEDMEAAKKLFEESKRPDAAPFRFRLRRVDGTEVWTHIQGSPMQSAGGEVYGISATLTASEDRKTGRKHRR